MINRTASIENIGKLDSFTIARQLGGLSSGAFITWDDGSKSQIFDQSTLRTFLLATNKLRRYAAERGKSAENALRSWEKSGLILDI